MAKRESVVAKRAMVEPLEQRQLMSLVVDVRLPGGGKEASVDHVGQVVNMEVWATVTGNDTTVTNDGLQIVVGSLLSTNITGGSASGTLKATLLSPFNASGSTPGQQVDLDGDGDLDIGTHVVTQGGNFLFARSASMTTTGGTAVSKGQSFKFATATFTVTSLLGGVETNLTYRPRGAQNGW